MATYYVRGTNGSDAADGLSYANAMKTLAVAVSAAVLAGGTNTIYCSESAIGGSAIAQSVSNLTIMQDPDTTREQFVWKGSTVISGSWTGIGGNVYTKSITSGLGAGLVAAVLYNYDTSANSRGSYCGTLLRKTAAADVVTAATGTAGCFYYETATGLITAYFGGQNPNTDAVLEYVARDNVSAIDLTGNGNLVQGLHFKAWHNDAQGACVWLKDGTSSSQIVGCKSWDAGPHAFVCSGQAALMAGATINMCQSRGAKSTAAHFTFFQTNGFGNTSNLRFENCHVERHTWLNIDGTETTACTQTGWYCHSDAGTPLQDMVMNGCTSWDQSDNASPICALGTAAPSSATSWSGYYGRAENCTFLNMTRYVNSDGYFAFRKCYFTFPRQGSSGLCRYGSFGLISASVASGALFFESCVIVSDSGGDSTNSVIGIHARGVANAHCRFVNCSILDIKSVATTGQSTLITLSATATSALTFTGCILSFLNDTTDQQSGVYSDGSTALNLADNLYGLFPDGFSIGVGSITGAGGATGLTPSGCSDANALEIAASPYISSTNLRISPNSAGYGRKRQTSAVLPTAGIDGPYVGIYGAYQGTATGMRTRDGDASRSSWRMR